MNVWVPHALRNCGAPDDAEAEAPSPAAPSPAAPSPAAASPGARRGEQRAGGAGGEPRKRGLDDPKTRQKLEDVTARINAGASNAVQELRDLVDDILSVEDIDDGWVCAICGSGDTKRPDRVFVDTVRAYCCGECARAAPRPSRPRCGTTPAVRHAPLPGDEDLLEAGLAAASGRSDRPQGKLAEHAGTIYRNVQVVDEQNKVRQAAIDALGLKPVDVRHQKETVATAVPLGARDGSIIVTSSATKGQEANATRAFADASVADTRRTAVATVSHALLARQSISRPVAASARQRPSAQAVVSRADDARGPRHQKRLVCRARGRAVLESCIRRLRPHEERGRHPPRQRGDGRRDVGARRERTTWARGVRDPLSIPKNIFPHTQAALPKRTGSGPTPPATSTTTARTRPSS